MRPYWIMAILYTVHFCSPSGGPSHSPPAARCDPAPAWPSPEQNEENNRKSTERVMVDRTNVSE